MRGFKEFKQESGRELLGRNPPTNSWAEILIRNPGQEPSVVGLLLAVQSDMD